MNEPAKLANVAAARSILSKRATRVAERKPKDQSSKMVLLIRGYGNNRPSGYNPELQVVDRHLFSSLEVLLVLHRIKLLSEAKQKKLSLKLENFRF